MGKMAIDPFVFTNPDDANGDGFPSYPSGRGTRVHWGGGAQLGVYYIHDCYWHFGASIKSPQWMEDFRFHSEDELGFPRVVKTKFDLPMIISMGLAYSGRENLLLAVDFRYVDYENTDGFGDPAGFDPTTGAVTGLGWESVFAMAAGMQYRWNDATYLRLGYTYTQNPISESTTFFNFGAPLYYQHVFSVGSSTYLTPRVSVNLAYSYLLNSSSTGPIYDPGAGVPIPGTTVTSELSAHMVLMGVSVRY
jgi:long-chain fatty acid transport protein